MMQEQQSVQPSSNSLQNNQRLQQVSQQPYEQEHDLTQDSYQSQLATADADDQDTEITNSQKLNSQMQQDSKQHDDQYQKQQPLENYLIKKTLGKGNFGKVKLALHRLTDQHVAIKILQKDLIFQQTDIVRISRQLKIMKKLNHPFVVQLYEIIQTPKQLYLVMEYAEGGDLFEKIVQEERISQKEASSIYSQLAMGLQYMHQKGVTHRDLKPENILLAKDGIIKIADFGLGNMFKPQEKLKTACGSPCYASPQMLNKQAYDPQCVDIWSSGIILYAMVCGYLPFQDPVTSKLYEKIKSASIRLPSWVSSPCRSIIRGLLTKDPKMRLQLDQVLAHQFVSNNVDQYKKHCEDVNPLLNRRIDQVSEKYGIVQRDKLLSDLNKNRHNALTTLYYLGVKGLKDGIGVEKTTPKFNKQEKEQEEQVEYSKSKQTMIASSIVVDEGNVAVNDRNVNDVFANNTNVNNEIKKNEQSNVMETESEKVEIQELKKTTSKQTIGNIQQQQSYQHQQPQQQQQQRQQKQKYQISQSSQLSMTEQERTQLNQRNQMQKQNEMDQQHYQQPIQLIQQQQQSTTSMTRLQRQIVNNYSDSSYNVNQQDIQNDDDDTKHNVVKQIQQSSLSSPSPLQTMIQQQKSLSSSSYYQVSNNIKHIISNDKDNFVEQNQNQLNYCNNFRTENVNNQEDIISENNINNNIINNLNNLDNNKQSQVVIKQIIKDKNLNMNMNVNENVNVNQNVQQQKQQLKQQQELQLVNQQIIYEINNKNKNNKNNYKNNNHTTTETTIYNNEMLQKTVKKNMINISPQSEKLQQKEKLQKPNDYLSDNNITKQYLVQNKQQTKDIKTKGVYSQSTIETPNKNKNKPQIISKTSSYKQQHQQQKKKPLQSIKQTTTGVNSSKTKVSNNSKNNNNNYSKLSAQQSPKRKQILQDRKITPTSSSTTRIPKIQRTQRIYEKSNSQIEKQMIENGQQLKLYERSHSKDRPLILSKKFEKSTVTALPTKTQQCRPQPASPSNSKLNKAKQYAKQQQEKNKYRIASSFSSTVKANKQQQSRHNTSHDNENWGSSSKISVNSNSSNPNPNLIGTSFTSTPTHKKQNKQKSYGYVNSPNLSSSTNNNYKAMYSNNNYNNNNSNIQNNNNNNKSFSSPYRKKATSSQLIQHTTYGVASSGSRNTNKNNSFNGQGNNNNFNGSNKANQNINLLNGQAPNNNVIGKHCPDSQPSLINSSKIVLLTGSQFCSILSKKGFVGKVEYYEYAGQGQGYICLLRTSLKLSTKVAIQQKGYTKPLQLKSVIHEVNLKEKSKLVNNLNNSSSQIRKQQQVS